MSNETTTPQPDDISAKLDNHAETLSLILAQSRANGAGLTTLKSGVNTIGQMMNQAQEIILGFAKMFEESGGLGGMLGMMMGSKKNGN